MLYYTVCSKFIFMHIQIISVAYLIILNKVPSKKGSLLMIIFSLFRHFIKRTLF